MQIFKLILYFTHQNTPTHINLQIILKQILYFNPKNILIHITLNIIIILKQILYFNQKNILIPKYKKNNDTQTSEQSYPDRDQGIITPFYQSNYARSLQNQHMPIEPMQTGQYNRLPIQNEQSRQIEHNRLPIQNEQSRQIEYIRLPIKN